MLELVCSPELRQRIDSLDDEWESTQLQILPFPLAWGLLQVREQKPLWDALFVGFSTLLRYLAIIGASEYFARVDEIDFALNMQLRNLSMPMSDGGWLALARQCASRQKDGQPRMTDLADIFSRMEKERRLRIGWRFDRISLNVVPSPLLNSLVAARNRLYGHIHTVLSAEEKNASAKLLRSVYRLALDELTPLWRWELRMPIQQGDGQQFHSLRGLMQVALPDALETKPGVLRIADERTLALYPLTFTDQAPKGARGVLSNGGTDLFFISEAARKKPVFSGLGGGSISRHDLAPTLASMFEGKRVWETIPIKRPEELLERARELVKNALRHYEENNLHRASQYVGREQIDKQIKAFLRADDSRLMFIAGESGCGKTATALHWADELLAEKVPVLIARGVELAPDEVSSREQIEQWICSQLSFDGKFADVLDAVEQSTSRHFVLIYEGINEFIKREQDVTEFWKAINQLVNEYQDRPSLKVIVTTRVDSFREKPAKTRGAASSRGIGSLEMFFPRGELPAFADGSLYFQAEGRPWVLLGGMTLPEIIKTLQEFGFDERRAEATVHKHREALRNPYLLTRFAEGILSGAEIKRLSAEGLTRSFVKRAVSADSQARQAIEQIVVRMNKEQSLELTIDDLKRRDAKLFDKLEANDKRLLKRLREIGLIQINRAKDAEGSPTWSLAISHDSVYEALLRRENQRVRIKNLLLLTGALLMLILAVFFLMWKSNDLKYGKVFDLVRTTAESEVTLASKSLGLPEVNDEELKQGYESTLSAAIENIYGMWNVWIGSHLILVLMWITIVAAVFSASSAVGYWSDRRNTFDSRVRYFGLLHEKKVMKRIAQVAFPAAVIAAAASAWMFLREPRLSDWMMGSPLLVVLFFMMIAGPGYVLWNTKQAVMSDSSGALRTYFLDPAMIRRTLRGIMGFLPIMVIVFLPPYLAAGHPVMEMALRQKRFDQLSAQAEEHIKQMTQLSEEIAAKELMATSNAAKKIKHGERLKSLATDLGELAEKLREAGRSVVSTDGDLKGLIVASGLGFAFFLILLCSVIYFVYQRWSKQYYQAARASTPVQ